MATHVRRAAVIGALIILCLSAIHPVVAGDEEQQDGQGVSPGVEQLQGWSPMGDSQEDVNSYWNGVVQLAEQTSDPMEHIVAQDRLRYAGDEASYYANTHPDDFAGVINQHGKAVDFQLRFKVVEGHDAAIEAVRALLPDNYPVAFESVTYSQTQLAEEARLLADEARNPALTFGVDIENNAISVDTPGGEQGEAWQLVPATDFPLVVEDSGTQQSLSSCTDNTSCSPIRGGLQLCAIGNPGCTGGCGSGGTDPCYGSSTLWAHGTTIAQTKYLITAGHVGSAWGLHSADIKVNGTNIGNSSVNSLELTSPDSDSRRILATNPCGGGTTFCNRIFETTSTWASITAVRGVAYIDLYDNMCKSGWGYEPQPDLARTNGYLCGEITQVTIYEAVDLNGDGDYNDDGDHSSIESSAGDFNGGCGANDCYGSGLRGGNSGAAVFWGSWFFGDGTSDAGLLVNKGLFSRAPKIQNDLDVYFCLNDDCTSP